MAVHSLALAFAAGYIAMVLQLSGDFKRLFGTEVEGYFANCAPRWRCALGMLTQVCTLPPLFAWSARDHGYSLRRWGERYAAGSRSTSDWAFVYVFAAFMILDWHLIQLRPMMTAHHIVCLAGHVYAAFVVPAGFPRYFAGVCALELGSASCNLFCMYASSTVVAAVYVTTLSATHLITLACVREWCTVVHRRSFRALGVALALGLVVIRQREAIAACRSILAA